MTVKDMTTGNPTKLILGFALPLYIGNLFQQLYNLVDTLIVGRTLGVNSLAAVGSTGAIAFLVLGFIFGLTSGFSVITAQRFGAKDFQGVRKSFAAIVILSIIFSVFLTVISSTTAMPLLQLMNTPQNIINEAFSYIFIMYLGIGTIVFYNALANVIRSLGDSKTPLFFLIIASILNILLDIVFIVKFNMGVAGAGWATVIAQGVSSVLCLMFMLIKFPILRLNKNDWKTDWSFMWEHIRIGFPMGFQMSVMVIGIIALQIVLNSFGSDSVAAFTAGTKIEQVSGQSFLAIGVAMATYTAQNYGAGKINRIKLGALKCLKINTIITFINIAVIFFLGRNVVNIFIVGDYPHITSQAQLYMSIICLFHFCLGTILLYRNILQGMGIVKIPFLSGIIELVMRAGTAPILGYYFGYLGICLATPCAWVAGAIWLSLGYLRVMKKLSQNSQPHPSQLSFLTLNK